MQNKIFEPVNFEIRKRKVSSNKGGNDGGNTMEARVAKLESDVENIKTNITDIKSDVREIRNDIKDIKSESKSDLIKIFGVIGTAVATLAGLMAKGFGWL